jgi:hypothetical protein
MAYRAYRGVGDIPLSIALKNLASGRDVRQGTGGDFTVGDKWRVSVGGAPANQPVTVCAWQGGISSSGVPLVFMPDTCTDVGKTDAAGAFSLDGGMDAGTVGTWVEIWKVPGAADGGSAVSLLNFLVGARPASSPPSPPAPPPPAPPAPPAGGGAAALPWFTDSMFGGIPNWALLAAGVGAIFFLGG